MTTATRTVMPEFQHDLLHVGILGVALHAGLDLQQALEHPHDRLEVFGLGRQILRLTHSRSELMRRCSSAMVVLSSWGVLGGRKTWLTTYLSDCIATAEWVAERSIADSSCQTVKLL